MAWGETTEIWTQKSIADDDVAMRAKNEAARNPFISTSAKRHPWRL
jgi:hypothetical protein